MRPMFAPNKMKLFVAIKEMFKLHFWSGGNCLLQIAYPSCLQAADISIIKGAVEQLIIKGDNETLFC